MHRPFAACVRRLFRRRRTGDRDVGSSPRKAGKYPQEGRVKRSETDDNTSMATAEIIFEQVKTLPENLAREVLDFIGYVKERAEREAVRELMAAQETSLREIWEIPEDEVRNDAQAWTSADGPFSVFRQRQG